jgi:gas vesicle protein
MIAAGVGYVAGILTAPKSGKETRKDIERAAVRAKSEAEKRLKQLHAELIETLAEAKRLGQTLKVEAQNELAVLTDRATQARDQVREVLSALHEGESDDKDLDNAVKEVSKALNDLKNYLAKHDVRK